MTGPPERAGRWVRVVVRRGREERRANVILFGSCFTVSEFLRKVTSRKEKES